MIPQIADMWGKGTHDAKPGELEAVVASNLHNSIAYLHRALAAAQDIAHLPWAPTIDPEECREILARVIDELTALKQGDA